MYGREYRNHISNLYRMVIKGQSHRDDHIKYSFHNERYEFERVVSLAQPIIIDGSQQLHQNLSYKILIEGAKLKRKMVVR